MSCKKLTGVQKKRGGPASWYLLSMRVWLLFLGSRRAAVSPDNAIERILELSAEAQLKRREAAEDSPAFHKLTVVIVAYGKALGLLSRLKEVQTEHYSNN